LPVIHRGVIELNRVDLMLIEWNLQTSHSYKPLLQVAYPHCATCFGRCYPGGAALIMDAKNLYDGIGRLLATSSRELQRPANNTEGKKITENGDQLVVENGVTPEVEPSGVANADEKDQISPTVQIDEKQGDSVASV
jgi:hypothetical protein